MFKANKFFVALLIFFGTIAINAQRQQTIFDLEGKIQRPAVIPADVIAILKSEERVDSCFQEKGAGVKETEWFAASEIDLNGDRRKDLIIKAEDGCLFGVNQGPFWVFQNRPDGYQKVLAESGLQLSVLPRKVNAFNRIKISKIISMRPSSTVFTFKAGKYQLSAK